jgi:hypothetical protein
MTKDKKADLWKRMQAMFARWNYTEDEKQLMIEVAKNDPEGVLLVVEGDEKQPDLAKEL